MPPAEASTYQAALRAFQRAGADAAGGKFKAAEPWLVAGSTELTKVTAAANLPAPVNPPAEGNGSSS